MVHDPEEQRLFPRFPPEQVELLSGYGRVVELAPGEALFEQGRQPYDFWVVLEGDVRVTKEVLGEELLLTVHRPGEFAGELSILSGTPPIATGRAVGPVKALRIDAGRFRELVATCSPVAEIVLPAMTARVQEVGAQLQQQEKLAALGRMAAGLAHELNNPAAAVKRAAAQLDEAMAEAQSAAIGLHEEPLAPEQRALLDGLYAEARRAAAAGAPESPLERSDREDALCDWLDGRGVAEGWSLAPMLAAGGIAAGRLEEVERTMGAGRLPAVVRWLAASLAAAGLVRDLEQGAQRISLLVTSIKQYSHMDRAPELKDTDLHAGLESTLALLAHKLRGGVEVVREYDPALPRICAYPGELNQVWTNLIDNAVDAMGGRGRLWVRTSHEGDVATVEIADDGPGIPPEIRDRVWEPFFTTKGVGEGSGLGLDIVRKIVQRRHGGSVRVTSAPGDTRFRVNLRVDGPPRTAKPAATEAAAPSPAPLPAP
jgi:signal transduction histidine kinase